VWKSPCIYIASGAGVGPGSGFAVVCASALSLINSLLSLTFWPSTLKLCCDLCLPHSFQSTIYSHPFSRHCCAVEVARLNKRNEETLPPVAISVTCLKIPRHACNRITSVKYLAIRQRDWAGITRFRSVKSCASVSA